MMTNKLFNSVFENSLRIMLLLGEFDKACSVDMIYAADFMVSYGATFSMSETNLNGDNPYKFSEFASRREIVQIALKELVLDGLVSPSSTKCGVLYALTDTGRNYCQALNSDYAHEYRETAKKVVKNIAPKTERELINHINKLSTSSLRKGVSE